MEVQVVKVEKDSVSTLHVSGVLYYLTMNVFIEEVQSIKIGTKKVIIDFEKLEFIDSTGIGAIINLVHEASGKNFKIELVHVNEENRVLFDMIGVFEIIESLQMED